MGLIICGRRGDENRKYHEIQFKYQIVGYKGSQIHFQYYFDAIIETEQHVKLRDRGLQ